MSPTLVRVAKHKSRSVSKVSDARVARTHSAIGTAFADLLMRRPYERIRVSDITRKAAVGRATFYGHFASKEALLQAQFARVVAHTVVELPAEPCLVDCTRLFAHTRQAREIFRSLTSGPGHVGTERILQDVLEARLAALMVQRCAGAGSSRGFVPRFVASTVLALIAWSLEQAELPSAVELQRVFKTLVGRALA